MNIFILIFSVFARYTILTGVLYIYTKKYIYEYESRKLVS